jgi:hypothetical protein
MVKFLHQTPTSGEIFVNENYMLGCFPVINARELGLTMFDPP